MAFVLAIDTCGGTGSVQLLDTETEQILAEATLPGRETQEKLMPAIDHVLSQVTLQPEQLAALAVVTGPGSFTGVRVGMAAVKGLAESLGLPIAALSRLAVLAATRACPAEGATHAWLDAGRSDIYSGVRRSGDSNGSSFSESLLYRHTALASVGINDLVVVLEPALTDLVANIVAVSAQEFQQALCQLAVKAVQRGHFADTVLLDANYLRVPDAELAMQARTAAHALSGASQ